MLTRSVSAAVATYFMEKLCNCRADGRSLLTQEIALLTRDEAMLRTAQFLKRQWSVGGDKIPDFPLREQGGDVPNLSWLWHSSGSGDPRGHFRKVPRESDGETRSLLFVTLGNRDGTVTYCFTHVVRSKFCSSFHSVVHILHNLHSVTLSQFGSRKQDRPKD